MRDLDHDAVTLSGGTAAQCVAQPSG